MISVTIIAKNSSQTLDICLKSVHKLTDDVVVVIDKSSTDSSWEIARKYKAKIFYRPFDNFSNQKNFAISKTKYPWVFSLDADEYSSASLNKEMQNIVANTSYVGFLIPRLNIIFGKPIYHTNWGPKDDSHVWLFNKNSCYWEGKVHEEILCNGKTGLLKNCKFHCNYRTVEEFINKMNFYTTREALESRLYTNPIIDFLRRYILHTGFLDGWHGLFLSYLMMIYHLTVWVKKT